MKRILIIATILTITSLSYGQLFTHIVKIDKFDDIIWEKEVKTLCYIAEGTITIETKGQTPLTYIVEEITSFRGSEEEPINLVNDLWGYEMQMLTRGKNTSKPYTIVIRFIREEYTQNFKSLIWVEDPKDNTRTVYYY